MHNRATILIPESEATPSIVKSLKENFEVLIVPDRHYVELIQDAKLFASEIGMKKDTDEYLKDILEHIGDTDGC